jgi:glucose/arabinose dehydrogenase
MSRLNPESSLLLILLKSDYNNMKSAKVFWISLLILIGFVAKSQSQIFIGTTEIDTSSIVTGLDTPWEILWGPDDHIWLTERRGTISRLNPETSEITEMITIGDVYEQGESGLLGMVLHPDFINHPYVFVVYTYLDSGIKERLVRYTYSNGELASPVTMLEGIDGASNHNGSRLVIDAEQKLYMTTGDGANTSQPQDLNSLNGKVLRMNLDGSYPEDNPFQESYVWTWGHRNAQGLVISPLGIMYSSEHGPANDDEVNIIEKGRNYGWPDVEGFCDDPSETQFCADSNVMEPIAAWTPTLAVAGTGFYSHFAIPEWQNSLLVTSLKASSLTTLRLSADGRSVITEEIFFEDWFGRLRDICISPDGRVFLAVSNRDGRGTVLPGDDRIVEIVSLNVTEYCSKEENASICPGETYNFYGQEIGQPGIYTDTIISAVGCDTIVSLLLNFFDLGSIGLVDSVMMALNETVTLTINDGFISYEWNNDPSLDENTITIVGSELGEGSHYYTLEVEDINGCNINDTVEVIVSSAVGIHSLSNLEFSVYPNPVTGEELNIDYSIASEGMLIIYSQDGREVSRDILSPENEQIRIYLPETSGLYNLILSNKEGISHLKVLKL